MSCEHDCTTPPVFPKPIFNRPGLPRIDYRIGTYADLRAHLLDAIDKAPALQQWTHRGTDDPGIALLEGAAIVGDVLTFYQSLYANEAYLRTARWRESIIDLARLLGYRLAPGIGGVGLFAIALKPTAKPVTVPKGFGLKAQLEGADKPAEFESAAAITAYPHLSRFPLFKPFQAVPPALSTTMREFVLTRADGTRPDIKLAPGSRLLIGWPLPNAADPKRLTVTETLIVDSTHEELGNLVVRFKSGIKLNNGAPTMIAYALGDSYRHFGHNAPPTYFVKSGSTTVPVDTWYFRDDWEGDEGSYFPYIDFSARQLDYPLDREVKTLAAGSSVVIQADMELSIIGWKLRPYTLVAKIASVADKTLTYGSITGPSTVLTFEENLLKLLGEHNVYEAFRMHLQTATFHEVRGEPMRLRAKDAYVAANSGNALAYYGTGAEVQAFKDRKLMLVHADGSSQVVHATGLEAGALTQPDAIRHRGILLDKDVVYGGFLHPEPATVAYGNLVSATQGKTLSEAPIGSGDARQTFQTFAVPKAPLTYLLDPTQSPAHTPELSIYVGGSLWRKVDTLFDSPPDAHVYVVREDAEGKSYVQFGDDKSGARLPSGRNNVVAAFRVGSGAYGELKPDTQPQATAKLAGLDKVYLPQPVTTGAAPEAEDNARAAAPGRVQSLGRLVSLADFESEALALPNVQKATAAWEAPEGVPLVHVTVLTQSGNTADLEQVRAALATANRARGTSRFPIHVTRGLRLFLRITLTAGFDSTCREQDVRTAIQRALGVSGGEADGLDGSRGLFGLHARRFGETAHTSQIIGAVQQVEGVSWVTLKAAQIIPFGWPPQTDPTLLEVPTYESIPYPAIPCPSIFILALYTTHLTVNLTSAPAP